MTDIKPGLEVVAWQDAENPLYTTGEKRQMHGWATDGYPIVELVRLSDATAVIDQLRAENEVLTLRVMAGERQELDALKSAPVVMPSVTKVMNLVLDYQTNKRTNVTGTTNWAANLGMAVVDEIARLNRSKT